MKILSILTEHGIYSGTFAIISAIPSPEQITQVMQWLGQVIIMGLAIYRSFRENKSLNDKANQK
jgi:hypothetical protein